jgi:hypothetical protein
LKGLKELHFSRLLANLFTNKQITMKVYITGTPLVDRVLIDEVISTLSKIKGPITFHALDNLEVESIRLVIKDFDEGGEITERLEFDKLIKISSLYRLTEKIDKNNILVILTSIQMVYQFDAHLSKNWFSYYRDKNVIIRTNNWENFVGDKLNAAIAHQIIENTFQTLLGDTFKEYHFKSKSCINDFCEDEEEIVHKLMSCRICNDCLNLAIQKHVDLKILDQIRETLNLIRDKFSIFELLDNKISDEVSSSNIAISKELVFTVDDVELNLAPILKTVLLFFMINNKKEIRSDSLRKSNWKTQLLTIHGIVKKGGSEKAIVTLLGLDDDNQTTSNIGDVNKDLLKDYRHQIKKEMTLKLGRMKGEYFAIQSINGPKGFVNVLLLKDEQIKIDDAILNQVVFK